MAPDIDKKLLNYIKFVRSEKRDYNLLKKIMETQKSRIHLMIDEATAKLIEKCERCLKSKWFHTLLTRC